ncbi:hypothetical protein [Acinetobacter sp. ANC 5054]|uniref:hypothetical protein n=1 Tax=Acinetobacter sp. ANC 5054 TaxID=1977877 RepID=UPI0011780D28|nr:hypothetical protein [Acinetobacter sp. ANC 5054]
MQIYVSSSLFFIFLIGSTETKAQLYQHCSSSEIQKLQRLFPDNDNDNDKQPAFQDCIQLQYSHRLLALSSNATGVIQDNAGNYDLKLYLLDKDTLQVLKVFKSPKGIVPTTRLDNVQFDLNAYAKDQELVGIALKQSHIGGINSSKRLLNLYAIHTDSKISVVLNGLMTNYNSSTQSACDDWNTEEFKRSLHISNQTYKGYPIFLIKESSINSHYNHQNCKAIVEHDQGRYQLKFDGKEYPIQHIKKNDPDL